MSEYTWPKRGKTAIPRWATERRQDFARGLRQMRADNPAMARLFYKRFVEAAAQIETAHAAKLITGVEPWQDRSVHGRASREGDVRGRASSPTGGQ